MSVDLSTKYLGLGLRSPLVASAGPIQQNLDGVRALADSGVGAIVMYSLFEEQVRHEEARQAEIELEYMDSFAESLSFFPTVQSNKGGITAEYLAHLEASAKAVDIPVIASLNGATKGGWVETAHRMQEAGAAAIECNIYMVPGAVDTTADEVEDRHVEILSAVRDAVDIPVAVKLSPFFSAPGNMIARLDAAGADGLVLFNRFLQPDIDTEKLEVVPGVWLSNPTDSRIPLTWIASLSGRVKASLAATSGVETADDVLKYLLAGADVVMTTSSLVRHGAGYAADLIDGVSAWLERKGLTLDQARGLLAVPADASSSEYERNGYVSALEKAKATYGA
ncbi:Dihydroorotate dehydrogenase B (NAD(+)), catalytic subunit [Acidipropionibacterium jensenii]|uniref:Dihydroorotate dehydrogenase B (NAD(+)), catalytic subunit n=1 Tax=Acidipropionibacterium jensenii TaxID=1749 RepID=A0A448NYQ8_9ACTN|nr:dihydroorotate dehydrogenase-like protein [Acidipropionibacterium jensenii]VEI03071.1 Dihydroorotate dehydrogenase B (NAD(+)), catalytic subunit [Acidipropionibacterium jensenii]